MATGTHLQSQSRAGILDWRICTPTRTPDKYEVFYEVGARLPHTDSDMDTSTELLRTRKQIWIKSRLAATVWTPGVADVHTHGDKCMDKAT